MFYFKETLIPELLDNSKAELFAKQLARSSITLANITEIYQQNMKDHNYLYFFQLKV